MRICKCGCGRSIEHRNKNALFFSDKCKQKKYYQKHSSEIIKSNTERQRGYHIKRNFDKWFKKFYKKREDEELNMVKY